MTKQFSNTKLIRKYLTQREQRLLTPQQAYELAKFTQQQARVDARYHRHHMHVQDIDRIHEWTGKIPFIPMEE